MKKIARFLVIIVVPLVLGSTFQAFYTVSAANFWMRSYGREEWTNFVYDAGATLDGGSILGLNSYLYGSDNNDLAILRLDSNGNIVWQTAFDGGDEDYSSEIIQTSDGSFVALLTTSSFSDAIWIIKLDANGNPLWQKTFSGGVMNSIQETSDGGYLLAGASYNPTTLQDAWAMKLSSDGNIVWQKNYGANLPDSARTVHLLDSGDFILVGSTRSFGAGSNDVWVLKLDVDGNLIWQKTYGGNGNDWALGSDLTTDSGIVLAGYTDSFGAGMTDAWVVKLDLNGNITWQKTFGLANNDQAWSVVQIQDGGYIIGGYYSIFDQITLNTDGWLMKLNSDGSLVWEKGYGGSMNDEVRALVETTDHQILASGILDYKNAWAFEVNPNDGDLTDCAFVKAVTTTTGNSTASAQNTELATQITSSLATTVSIAPYNPTTSPNSVCEAPPFIPTDFIYLPLVTK